QAGIRSR
ncbi:type-F conjugative transfer system secretin TraK, partial [Escherichia coli EC1865]